MGSPLPWGSRPLGNPEFPYQFTYQSGLGRPLIPTPGVSSPGHRRESLQPLHGERAAYGDVALSQRSDGATGWPCRDWTSGSLALTVPLGSRRTADVADIGRLPLSRHALVPRAFRP